MQRAIDVGLASSPAQGLAAPGAATAQTARDLVGSWEPVSITAEQGGRKVELFGENPRGLVVFGADGRYVLLLARRDLPRFASNARPSGTAEENRAVVQGSFAHAGTYAVDEASKAIVFRIETSTFPNFDGTEQRRSFTLSGDTLTYAVPTSSAGQGAARSVFRRAK
jgi:Lipocalin-like domain